MADHDICLSVRDLHVVFALDNGLLHALRGVSLDIRKGECLAVVGESGSGKSVLCRSCMGLLPGNGRVVRGSLLYGGKDLLNSSLPRAYRGIRGKAMALVMQNASSSFNPVLTIGRQLTEAFSPSVPRRERKQRALSLLSETGLGDPEKVFSCYPHELSGGMCQRALIAMALAGNPEIIFFDEPTSSLDAITQVRVLELIRTLSRTHGHASVLVTHDLSAAAFAAGRIAVMYAGQIVEEGLPGEIFHDGRHPYTRALIASHPARMGDSFSYLTGTPPSCRHPIRGDAFAPRNPAALAIDFLYAPPYFPVTPTHRAKTWLLDPRYPEALSRLKPGHAARTNPMAKSTPALPAEPGKGNENGSLSRDSVLLRVSDLHIRFGRGERATEAVKGVSFDLREGECLGLVGESGSGKTSIANAILRLVPAASGSISYRGRRLDGRLSAAARQYFLKEIQMVFQNPAAAINPRAKVMDIVREGLDNIHPELPRKERSRLAIQALCDVGLKPEDAFRFPYSFSGGQLQRIGLARVLVMSPSLIVADEPVSSLDMSVRAQIMELMLSLQEKRGISFLLISHDLAMMRRMCGRIAVIKDGQIVEMASSALIFEHPRHPYTRALLAAMLNPDLENAAVKP